MPTSALLSRSVEQTTDAATRKPMFKIVYPTVMGWFVHRKARRDGLIPVSKAERCRSKTRQWYRVA